MVLFPLEMKKIVDECIEDLEIKPVYFQEDNRLIIKENLYRV